VDRAVNAATAEQRCVGGIDDRIDRERRDVGLDGAEQDGHVDVKRQKSKVSK
jgi:hypothetical protein